MTDDTDDNRRTLYGHPGSNAPKQHHSDFKPRTAKLVPLPDSVARDMEAVFALNAEHFAKSR